MTDVQPLSQRVRFGAYAANEPWPNLQAHYALEADMGVRFPIMSWFLGMESGWPAAQAEVSSQTGHDLLLCWQPSNSRAPVPFKDILSGVWDRRLDRFFTAAAAYPHQVTIRFAHEMNLGQMVQSIANPTPCTADLDVWLDTWRYLVDRQRSIGGSIQWQWCVNSLDMGGVPAESYWPGADYVDVLGIDTYNGYGPWTSAVKLLRPMYERITALDPTAPVWVSEIGCRAVSLGESYSKAAWFQDLFSTTEMPRLNTIVFFNALKERDWRITTADARDTVSSILVNAQRTTTR